MRTLRCRSIPSRRQRCRSILLLQSSLIPHRREPSSHLRRKLFLSLRRLPEIAPAEIETPRSEVDLWIEDRKRSRVGGGLHVGQDALAVVVCQELVGGLLVVRSCGVAVKDPAVNRRRLRDRAAAPTEVRDPIAVL